MYIIYEKEMCGSIITIRFLIRNLAHSDFLTFPLYMHTVYVHMYANQEISIEKKIQSSFCICRIITFTEFASQVYIDHDNVNVLRASCIACVTLDISRGVSSPMGTRGHVLC